VHTSVSTSLADAIITESPADGTAPRALESERRTRVRLINRRRSRIESYRQRRGRAIRARRCRLA